MATGNPDFDRLFKKVIDTVNKPEEEYPWVNRPVQPITEPRGSSGRPLPVVVGQGKKKDQHVYFTTTSSPVLSAIADLHKVLSV